MINVEVVAKLIVKSEKKEKDIVTWKQSTQRRIQNLVEHQQLSFFCEIS